MDRQFGFIHDKLDIKILILFVLHRLSAPVSLETLADLSLCDNGVNYFDFAECVADLVRTEHVSEEDGLYSITEKGVRNGEITETSLPYSVRIKAERAAADADKQQKRDAMIRTGAVPGAAGGQIVTLSMSDGIEDIFDLHILVGDAAQAARLQKQFRAHAEKFYRDFLAGLEKA